MPEQPSPDVSQMLHDLEQLEATLTLTPTDLAIINSQPSLFADVYAEICKSVLLHHFSAIVYAIVEKAKHGDVQSAKFIADLVGPVAAETPDLMRGTTTPEWETKAIALRDSLGLEISANDLVVKLLDLAKTNPERITER